MFRDLLRLRRVYGQTYHWLIRAWFFIRYNL